MLNKLADGIYTIDKFLSESECQEFIAMSEEVGYKPADVDMHGERKMFTAIRSNERVDIESMSIAEQFWGKLSLLELPSVENKVAFGLTPYLRFYRYQGEQKFSMHKDGSNEFNGNHTFYTMLIYLNTLSESGATRFREADLHVYPAAGKALIFRHDLWHAGMPVGEGVKYVLRTDILFHPSRLADESSGL
jgi:prolyl 4-hydroxylase